MMITQTYGMVQLAFVCKSENLGWGFSVCGEVFKGSGSLEDFWMYMENGI